MEHAFFNEVSAAQKREVETATATATTTDTTERRDRDGIQDSFGWTVLHWAVLGNAKKTLIAELIRCTTQRRSLTNLKDNIGYTALMWAIELHRDHEMIQALLNFNSNTSLKNIYHETCFDVAYRMNDVQSLQILGNHSNHLLTITRDAMMCKLCMDAPINTFFPACQHVGCCDKCAQDLKECPFCRKSFFNEQGSRSRSRSEGGAAISAYPKKMTHKPIRCFVVQ